MLRLLISLFAASLAVAPFAFAQTAQPLSIADVPVFRGSPYQVGLQHGDTFAKELQALTSNVVREHLPTWYHRWIAQFAAWRMQSHFPNGFEEEMRGIADGAKVSYHDILYGNLLADINALFGNPFGCSTVAVLPARSSHGQMIVGRNLDWYHGLAGFMRESLRTFVIAREGDRPILVVGYPGMVGVLTGVNDRGLLVSLMYSKSDDQTSAGIPVTFLLRKILAQSGTVAEARAAYVRGKPRTIAINTLLADGTTAAVVESSANREAIRQPRRGLIYSANHFVTPELKNDQGPDYRWPVITKFDEGSQTKISAAAVRSWTADLAMKDDVFHNVKAVVLDYGTQTLRFGAHAETAAAGPMTAVDLSAFLQTPKVTAKAIR